MSENQQKVSDKGEREIEKYEYKEVMKRDLEADDQKRLNSLGKESESIKRIQKEREAEQKEILELRSVIKQAAQDNAEELTGKIQRMLADAKDLMEKNSQTLTNESIEGLRGEVVEMFEKILSPVEDIKGFLDQDGKSEELQKIQNTFLENLEKIDTVLTEQAQRVDILEGRTKDIIKNIVEKIIGVEISNQSERIVQTNITLLFEEFKTAQNIEILLSQEDYAMLEEKLEMFFEGKGFTKEKINIKKDKNIKRGSFLILTDKGNFDNSIENKVKLVIDSIL